jgi:hypothetical protein
VLGLADEAERAEFEQMCNRHPEVLAAREAFEIQLEQQVLGNAVTPPQRLKESLFEQIALEHTAQTNGSQHRATPPPRAIVVPMVMRYVAAALVILLAGSAILNIYYFNKYKEFSGRYDQLLAQQTELVKNNSSLQTKLNNYETSMAIMTDPKMAVIKMDANNVPSHGSPQPGSLATIYWNTATKDVFLKVNKLPMPEAGKQYQLWAIVDGQPVDAGMLDMAKSDVIVKMKNIPRAQLFAVTLEQQGGSPTPKGPMYVMGKV